jgi:hypothetical protein
MSNVRHIVTRKLNGSAAVHVPMPEPYTLRAYTLTKRYGVGGQLMIELELKRFFDDESIEFQHERTQFYSSVYGGPIVIRTESGFETRVSSKDRFPTGRLNELWLEGFYAFPAGSLSMAPGVETTES